MARIELIKRKVLDFFSFSFFSSFIKGFETFKNKKSQPRGHMGRAEMFFEASRALSNTSGGKIYENVCRTHSLACQNHLQASRKIRFARINADRQSFDPECSWNQLHMDTSSYWKQVCTIVLPYTLCVYVMDEIQTYTVSIFSLKVYTCV